MISLTKIDPVKLSDLYLTEHSMCAGRGVSRELVEVVTQYAQTGKMQRATVTASKKGATIETMRIQLAVLTACLLLRPFDLAPANLSDLLPSSEMAVVLIAAHARTIIAEGKEVSVLELSTLAVVDESVVRRLIRAGEISSTLFAARAGGHRIKASVARAWLAMRKVPGFEPVKGKKKLRHVSPQSVLRPRQEVRS